MVALVTLGRVVGLGRGCRAQVPGDGIRSYEGLTLVTITLLSLL
jgi:hypothetical protein